MRNKQLSHYGNIMWLHATIGGKRYNRILHIFAYAETASSAICCSICCAPSLPISLPASFPLPYTRCHSAPAPPLYIEMHFVALPLEKANFTKISIINCSLAKCKNASKQRREKGRGGREKVEGKRERYIAIKIRLAAMQILFIKLVGEGQFHKTLATQTAIMPNRPSGRGSAPAPPLAPLCQ